MAAPEKDDTLDAFDRFNQAQGQGMGGERDPYPGFAELRRKGPIHPVESPFPADDGQPGPPPGLQIYTVCSHEAVSEVLRDGRRFSSKGYEMTMGPVMGHTILEMDDPEHARYRALLQRAFSRKALQRWKSELIGPIVNRLIDGFVDRGSADLVRELCFPFPVGVIAGMIGLPDEELEDFHRLAIELISVGFAPDRALVASRELGEMFARVLELRRAEPQDDLISVLADAELDGTRLSDPEIFAFCRLLAPAGAETTYRSSSNLLMGLLSHPDQLEAVRSDRSLIPQAIEEGLRWECPLTGILRTATEDTEVCGMKIPAGAMVHVNLGSANRDETRHENPENFNIFRPQKAHMAFAFGPHRCLGMHLATLETSIVLNALFDRLPGLRLDPEAADVHISGLIFRSPLSLPVLFGPV